ncbi:hypothetical protein GO986_17150 [Deinococcus sp. HMF7620]|uniref:Uncharacterized protein n=1 Tax=Deinococcus arboris TaxID=2682977 RepID=A0A7C9HTE8_9DEIO|nr:hypothetical protein [Deinococcus arboris]MVN88472.1 hypothetical protein [Deinococcus arboris]
MSTVLILALLIGTPIWLLVQFSRVRSELDRKGRSVEPLTGALFFEGQQRAREGLKARPD